MVSFVIICHRGELEIMTSFLVWSLKRYCQGEYSIHIGVPEAGPHALPLQPEIADYFTSQGACIFSFSNKFIQAKKVIIEGDLISNKLYGLSNSFPGETVVFLDSDTVAIKHFEASCLTPERDLMVKPANRANVRQWREIYKMVEIEYPDTTITTTGDKKILPPYFNSGVISFNRKILPPLRTKWEELHTILSRSDFLDKKLYPPFHRDQVALALAIQDSGIDVQLLHECYNCPVRYKKIRTLNPVLLHYHNPYRLFYYPPLLKLFDLFNNEFPLPFKKSEKLWQDLFDSPRPVAYYRTCRYWASVAFRRISPFLWCFLSFVATCQTIPLEAKIYT